MLDEDDGGSEDGEEDLLDAEIPDVPEFDPRDVAMSWTVLSKIAKSPAHLRHAAMIGRTDEGSLSMKMGRNFHAVALGDPFVLFEPGQFTDKKGKIKTHKGVRSGEAWAQFKAEHAGKCIMSPSEFRRAHAMTQALLANADATRILFGPGVEREACVEWEKDGRKMRSHIDAWKRGEWLADLKMVKDAKPDHYQRSGQWANHHTQVCLYDEADRFITGRPDDVEIPLYLVTVEGAPPYPVVVWQLDATSLDAGRRTIGAWWNYLRICEESNQWPGYSQHIETFVCDSNDEDAA